MATEEQVQAIRDDQEATGGASSSPFEFAQFAGDNEIVLPAALVLQLGDSSRQWPSGRYSVNDEVYDAFVAQYPQYFGDEA